jgi:hypothetical protein
LFPAAAHVVARDDAYDASQRAAAATLLLAALTDRRRGLDYRAALLALAPLPESYQLLVLPPPPPPLSDAGGGGGLLDSTVLSLGMNAVSFVEWFDSTSQAGDNEPWDAARRASLLLFLQSELLPILHYGRAYLQCMRQRAGVANIGVDGRVDEAPLDMPSMEWDLVGFDARVARSRQVADSALLTTK